MIDPQAKPGPYIKLMALVVVLGLISALVTFAFMALVHQGTGLVWEQMAWTSAFSPSWSARWAACWLGCW
jgi:hypothetical protein